MTKARRKTAASAKRVAIYLRVSTAEQTTANQRRELKAVAARHGWTVVRVFEDAGVSGAKGRDERPALDSMLKAVARREVDMVAAWSVDRLGRSLLDLLVLLRELHAKGVDLFLHQQGLDTSSPSGRAMFQMMGVFAEFERAMIVERVRAGMIRAKASGTRSGKAIGRPPTPKGVRAAIQQAHAAGGVSLRRLAKQFGLAHETVRRILCGGD
jgi:DNA invertase Pin-like site-specific DNA recombinase